MNKTYENFEEWLKEHDEQIRADERRKFAEWLAKYEYIKEYNWTSEEYETVSADLIVAMYEEEQK